MSKLPLLNLKGSAIQSNWLEWISLGPDYEYPLIHVLYYTFFKWDQTNDIHLSGLPIQAAST